VHGDPHLARAGHRISSLAKPQLLRPAELADQHRSHQQGSFRWPVSAAPARARAGIMTHIHADLGQASLRPGRRRPNAAPLPGAHLRTRHVQRRERRPGFRSLELDTAESARLWHGRRRADPAGVSVAIGFALPTREAVDERYAELTSAG
jgi:hypothetical protein